MDSVFELFKIGIGPSSSHTVGPMKIAKEFVLVAGKKGLLEDVYTLKVEFFGSLGATGVGHGSDRAVVFGLMGFNPEDIDIKIAQIDLEDVIEHKKINLLGSKKINFDFNKDLFLHVNKFLDFHSNGIKLYMYNEKDTLLLCKTYFSIGGGAILDEDEIDIKSDKEAFHFPYQFSSANELLDKCRKHSLSISALMMQNELNLRSEKDVRAKLLGIWKVMSESVEAGCTTTGFLPKLGVRKRANEIFIRLKSKEGFSMIDPLEVMDWINLWALAVNEENACGGRVVTAPTNGAAGVIPAVMYYMNKFLSNSFKEYDADKVVNFLLTAGAIGLLYQKNASISGADVGCQGLSLIHI